MGYIRHLTHRHGNNIEWSNNLTDAYLAVCNLEAFFLTVQTLAQIVVVLRVLKIQSIVNSEHCSMTYWKIHELFTVLSCYCIVPAGVGVVVGNGIKGILANVTRITSNTISRCVVPNQMNWTTANNRLSWRLFRREANKKCESNRWINLNVSRERRHL